MKNILKNFNKKLKYFYEKKNIKFCKNSGTDDRLNIGIMQSKQKRRTTVQRHWECDVFLFIFVQKTFLDFPKSFPDLFPYYFVNCIEFSGKSKKS